ncbi:MFS transporter [Segetibacter sp. 3557_3]|uniref:MFS transporter n=1 Tax=Segetibacter sp. 3557_3 TaxID=2547429 RepID=UPI001058CDD2|nr:MFS transporter [Segetibacter sp. 3557_3]TDH21660.1 MFS transporter [Segetibacter sp. 3557_3]
MKLRPSPNLNEQQVQSGLKYFVQEGLAAEAMATFTGGTFLVAMAVLLKASNFQIGLLAALPILTNVFQFLSIWMVQRYKNRRAISVICSFLARVPLFIIGVLPLMFSTGTSINVLLCFLFFHYLFASISGASWNSWIKDVVPDKILGTYFSRKARLTQILNVSLSLGVAMFVDYIKSDYPQYEVATYASMFVVGGVFGMWGVYLLSRAPEPQTTLEDQKLFALLSKPLKDVNFRNLLTFHSFYAFATSLALPFFVVYMMKTIGLSFAWIIVLGLLAKFGSIFSLKFWGTFSDKYSNKTIISICAPTFITCILSWTFVSMIDNHWAGIALLIIIHLVSGISAAGIDLAINNLAIKLAPKNEAISYISARNIVVAIFAAAGPMAGGLMADFFATHHLNWNIEWQGPSGVSTFHLLELANWNFFFVISAVLALFSIQLVKKIKEQGEAHREMVAIVMRKSVQRGLRKNLSSNAIKDRIKNPVFLPAIKRRMLIYKFSREVKRTA